MKIGITFDLREDYGIERTSQVFADFCHPDEIGYMADGIRANGHEPVLLGNMYKLNEAILKGTFDCDLVLVCDEGIRSRNREAIVPALLELNRIPYIGSDAYCMGLSQNKLHTKLVAEALGISDGHLSHTFKKETDLTLLNFLTRVRIRKAMELLRTCRYKVYEVAEKVGFTNYAYFYQTYRKYTGEAPTKH